MALGLQLVALFFGLFMVYYTFLHFKRNEFNKNVFFFWMLIWLVFILIILFPSIIDPFINVFMFNRLLDFLTVIGFIFLVMLTFYNFTVVKKNENKIEALVRSVALRDAKILNRKKTKQRR